VQPHEGGARSSLRRPLWAGGPPGPLRRDTRKLKKLVVPCISLPNPLIYNERGATVLPKNATVSVKSATRPFCPPPLLLSFFPIKIKEKEKECGEKTRKGYATVSRGCLFFRPRNWRRATPHFVAFRGTRIRCSVRRCGRWEGCATEPRVFFACGVWPHRVGPVGELIINKISDETTYAASCKEQGWVPPTRILHCARSVLFSP
jgi:hypothetical protein